MLGRPRFCPHSEAMSLVKLSGLGFSPIEDSSGSGRGALPFTLQTSAGVDVDLWTDTTKTTHETKTTDSAGRLPGWAEEGKYVLTASGVSTPVEVVAAPLAPSGDTTGVTDSANLAAAIAGLGATGGKVRLGAGHFYWLTGPSAQGTVTVDIQGQGGVSSGNTPATFITYLGADTRCVDARSTYGFRLADVLIQYTNASFTGILIDLSHGTAATDSAYASIERCTLQGVGSAANCAKLVSLDKAIGCTVRETNFGKAVMAVQGRSGSGSYSNAISVERCYFNQTGGLATSQAPIQNAGRGWTVKGCFFEPLADGTSAGAYKNTVDQAVALTFEGCWFGDATTGTGHGTWIDFAGNCLRVVGCELLTGENGVVLANGSRACDVSANQFDAMSNGVTIGTGCSGLDVSGNEFASVTNQVVTSDNPKASFIQNWANFGIEFHGMHYIEGAELSADPAAPAADRGVLYFKDNGSGKTGLYVRFSSGAVQQIAVQP